MEGVKDFNFVNFSNSIDAIHRKFTTPRSAVFETVTLEVKLSWRTISGTI
jgi:hypothetical protein